MSQTPKDAKQDGFNPYHRWLGIPPSSCPPTYYQLLGLSSEETDVEVIHAAALRQTAYVRNFQTGPHSASAAQILSELAEARSALTDAVKRKAYDARLSASRSATNDEQRSSAIADSTHAPENFSAEDFDPEASVTSRRGGGPSPVRMAGILLGIAAIAVVGVLIVRSAVKEKPAANEVAQMPPFVPLPEKDRRPTPQKPPEETKPIKISVPKESPLIPNLPPKSELTETAPFPREVAKDAMAWLKDVERKPIHSLMLIPGDRKRENYRSIVCNDDEALKLSKQGWRDVQILGQVSAQKQSDTVPLWRHNDGKMHHTYYLSNDARDKFDVLLGHVWTKNLPGLDEVFVNHQHDPFSDMTARFSAPPETTRGQSKQGFSFFAIAISFRGEPQLVQNPSGNSGKWELVPNGSFENGMVTWADMHPGQMLGNFALSKAKSFAGSSSVVSVPGRDLQTNGFALKSDSIAGRFTEGQEYVLSAVFHTSGMSSGSLSLFVKGLNEKGKGIKVDGKLGVEGWHFVSISFPATHPTLFVYVVRDGTSKLGETGYVDAIAITPKDKFVPPEPMR